MVSILVLLEHVGGASQCRWFLGVHWPFLSCWYMVFIRCFSVPSLLQGLLLGHFLTLYDVVDMILLLLSAQFFELVVGLCIFQFGVVDSFLWYSHKSIASCLLNSRWACSHLILNSKSLSGTWGATRVCRPLGVRFVSIHLVKYVW